MSSIALYGATALAFTPAGELFVSDGTGSICRYIFDAQHNPTENGDRIRPTAVGGISDMFVILASTIPSPVDLTCTLQPGRAVGLQWTNGQAYDRCEVYRDGTAPANLLDGNLTGTSYTDSTAAIGDHTYYVRGISGTDKSGFANCSVTVPAVSPPTSLGCSNEPGRKVVLNWTNAEAYDQLEVYRDGTGPANLVASSVTGQTFTDTSVPVGTHEYRVRGLLGGAWSPFAGPCSAAVALETDFFVHIGSLSGQKGTEGEVTVSLDFDYIAADPPPGNVQGWSYGICNEVGLVEPLEIIAAGTDTAGLNGGAGPDFQSLHVYPGGVTVAMTIDGDGVETIAATNGWSDVRIRYRLTGAALNCDEVTDPLTGKLRACDTLGSPPVPSIASVDAGPVPASGSDGGAVQIGCSNQLYLHLQPDATAGNDEGRLGIVIDFNHDGTNAGQVQGWSYGICHDPAVLRAVTIELAPDTAGLNGGAGPDFSALDTYDGGITVVALVDTNAAVTVPPVNGWRDTVVSYFLLDTSGDCTRNPGGTVTAHVQPCSSLGKPGSPPVLSVMTIAGESVPLGGYEAPALEVRCGPLFVRGDANGDKKFDISDPITILSHLFLGQGTVRCRDALDGNDDGKVDISDGIYILGHLFLGTSAPPAPYPSRGRDPSPDKVDCERYPAQG